MLTHTRPIRAAALRTLQRDDALGLAAILGELNAVYPDDAIEAVEGFTDGTKDVLRTPWVEVAAPDWQLGNLSLGQVTGDLDINVVVRGHLEDPRGGRLYGRLEMLGQALLDCLMQPGAFGDGVTIRSIRGTYPVNPETDGNDVIGYYGYALMVFTVEVGEARTPIAAG